MALVRAGLCAAALVAWFAPQRVRAQEPPPQQQHEATVPELIDRYATAYGLSEWARQRAYAIAFCESRLDPLAHNRRSGTVGVFQFLPKTAAWIGVNPWDTEQNVEGAIRLMAAGQWHHWAACL